jgi:predicted site-specific integrase-resolvase
MRLTAGSRASWSGLMKFSCRIKCVVRTLLLAQAKEKDMKTAAIYARVSSDKQRHDKTIASQTATLVAFAKNAGYTVPSEWVIQDDGYSGASLVRPGLEQVRDLAAEGQIQAVLATR